MSTVAIRRMCRRASVLAAVSAFVAVTLPAQTQGTPARYTAVAVNMGSPGPAWSDRVDIVIIKWSKPAERDRLLTTLFEKGPEKLLDTLVGLPRVGYFRTPNSLSYDLHYALRTALPDGGERVVIMTDRYVPFWEAASRPRSIDYPFTVIELHLNADGKGEGKMSLATRITGDKENKIIVLENYATQPVLLTDVRREKAERPRPGGPLPE